MVKINSNKTVDLATEGLSISFVISDPLKHIVVTQLDIDLEIN